MPRKFEIVNCGRRQMEAALLSEFLKPGVWNQREIECMANKLRQRVALKLVNGVLS